jgi:hypothetical protein
MTAFYLKNWIFFEKQWFLFEVIIAKLALVRTRNWYFQSTLGFSEGEKPVIFKVHFAFFSSV